MRDGRLEFGAGDVVTVDSVVLMCGANEADRAGFGFGPVA